MVCAKIKNSVSTVTDLVLVLILVIGVFTGCFVWLQKNADDSGVTIDSKYNDTYTKLVEVRDDIDTKSQSIKTSVDNIGEAESTYQVAWNGLKGLGNAITLPIAFTSIAVNTYGAISSSIDVIPDWAKTLIFIGIVIFVVLLVLSTLKGDPRL